LDGQIIGKGNQLGRKERYYVIKGITERKVRKKETPFAVIFDRPCDSKAKLSL
jgi:hypothetical protein